MGKLLDPFKRFLIDQPFVILDGGLATELERMGADLNDPLWSAKILIETPHLIGRVHKNYLLAGADVITTATYQASFFAFAQKNIQRTEAQQLFDLSLELAVAARADFWADPINRLNRQYPLIAASLGPYGAHLADGSEYRGDYDQSLEEMVNWHRPQVEALSGKPEVSFLLFETIPSLREATAIARLMEAFPGQPFAISFSCKDGMHTARGDNFTDAVRICSASHQVVAIGVNCTAPEFISPLLKTIEGMPSRPLMVYPNSGEIWNATQHCWVENSQNQTMRSRAEEWYEMGARIIGGCCRTGPEQIRELREEMQRLIKSL